MLEIRPVLFFTGVVRLIYTDLRRRTEKRLHTFFVLLVGYTHQAAVPCDAYCTGAAWQRRSLTGKLTGVIDRCSASRDVTWCCRVHILPSSVYLRGLILDMFCDRESAPDCFTEDLNDDETRRTKPVSATKLNESIPQRRVTICVRWLGSFDWRTAYIQPFDTQREQSLDQRINEHSDMWSSTLR